MRLAFFVLLFANVAFLGFSLLSPSESGRARQHIAELEVRPGAIRFVGVADTPHSETARAEVTREPGNSQVNTPRPTAPGCLEWAGIAPQHLKQSRLLLASLTATYQLMSGGQADVDHYWVHIPDLKTSAAADSLLIQLKATGERDFALSRNAVEGTYDISLGAFKKEERAKQRYERFRSLGAVLTPPRSADRATYLVQKLGVDIETFVAAAQKVPGTTVTIVTCPESPTEKHKDTLLKTSSR